MEGDLGRVRLDTEAIVLGYAMSRLDTEYLALRDCRTWQDAFRQAARALGVPKTSLKNLRDEFDPLHSNSRQGWRHRPLRPSRQRVLSELEEVSDEALLELVSRILRRDDDATCEAIDSLAAVTSVAYNVAERLLTGRRAEEYFLKYCQDIIHVPESSILDMRNEARGFDFGVRDVPNAAIEVKGMKQASGGIQFTDREWTEAKHRRNDYWLVVVGNLAAEPVPRVIRDPHSCLPASCRYQCSVTAVWQARVAVSADRD